MVGAKRCRKHVRGRGYPWDDLGQQGVNDLFTARWSALSWVAATHVRVGRGINAESTCVEPSGGRGTMRKARRGPRIPVRSPGSAGCERFVHSSMVGPLTRMHSACVGACVNACTVHALMHAQCMRWCMHSACVGACTTLGLAPTLSFAPPSSAGCERFVHSSVPR